MGRTSTTALHPLRTRRSWMVTLADVEERMPRVWDSILKVEKERHYQK
jgi:hypothetical protein